MCCLTDVCPGTASPPPAPGCSMLPASCCRDPIALASRSLLPLSRVCINLQCTEHAVPIAIFRSMLEPRPSQPRHTTAPLRHRLTRHHHYVSPRCPTSQISTSGWARASCIVYVALAELQAGFCCSAGGRWVLQRFECALWAFAALPCLENVTPQFPVMTT